MSETRLVGMKDADFKPILLAQWTQYETISQASAGTEFAITVPDKAVAVEIESDTAVYLSHVVTGTGADGTRKQLPADDPRSYPVGNMANLYVMAVTGDPTVVIGLSWAIAAVPTANAKDDAQLQG